MMHKRPDYILFDKDTTAIVLGYQQDAIQRMLDFDYVCRRSTPSVAAIVDPTQDGLHKCFWGTTETLIPIYRTLPDAAAKHPDADVVVNFASYRSAYATLQTQRKPRGMRSVSLISAFPGEKSTGGWKRPSGHLVLKS